MDSGGDAPVEARLRGRAGAGVRGLVDVGGSPGCSQDREEDKKLHVLYYRVVQRLDGCGVEYRLSMCDKSCLGLVESDGIVGGSKGRI